MKTLKYILFGIIGIIVLLLIAAAFAEKTFSLQKEVTINKPAIDIYNYVRMHKNQVDWNAWYKMDTNAKINITGTDGELGSAWTWESEITGQGSQTIVALDPGVRIGYELHFLKPFESKASNEITFEAIDSTHTLVKNTFNGNSPYPMNLLHVLMNMDKMMGTPMQDGLNAIKANLEK